MTPGNTEKTKTKATTKSKRNAPIKKEAKNKIVQALRYNDGKPKLSYILDFPNAMCAVAAVCEQGAEKYERHNWKKGLPVSEIEDSLLRHALFFNLGEDHDAESKQLHAAHMMWNCMMLIETLARHPDTMDDRNNDHPTVGARSKGDPDGK